MGRQFYLCAAAAAVVLIASSASAATTNALARAVSLSGQIHVYTADPAMGPMLAAFCEEVREKFRKRVGDTDPWRAPIAVVVRLRSAQGPVPMPGEETVLRSSVVSVSGFLRFQIDLEPPPPVDAGRFVQMLVGVLCSEMGNRKVGKVEPGQQLARVPAWFVRGLANGLDADARERSLRVIKDAYGRGIVPRFSEIVEPDVARPGGVDAVLHNAACDVLVAALESQPDGRSKLRAFLLALRPNVPWQGALAEAFGSSFDCRGAAAMEKWWALALSRAATLIVPQAQSATETRRQLDALLRMTDPKLSASLLAGKLEAEDSKRFLKKTNELLGQLAPAEAALHAMAALAHPLYRPAIRAYMDAFDWLRKGKLRRFESSLADATEQRRRAEERNDAIARYVGSVEASLFPEDMVVRFGEWFQAGRPDAGATTPVGDYLDRVETGMK